MALNVLPWTSRRCGNGGRRAAARPAFPGGDRQHAGDRTRHYRAHGRHPWPGNARESAQRDAREQGLRHGRARSRRTYLAAAGCARPTPRCCTRRTGVTTEVALREVERRPTSSRYVRRTDGENKSRARRHLGLARKTLYRKLAEYAQEPERATRRHHEHHDTATAQKQSGQPRRRQHRRPIVRTASALLPWDGRRDDARRGLRARHVGRAGARARA